MNLFPKEAESQAQMISDSDIISMLDNAPEAATIDNTVNQPNEQATDINNVVQNPTIPQDNGISAGQILDAKMVVSIVDSLGKNLLTPTVNKLLKTEIPKSQMGLSNAEKDALEPLMKEALNSTSIKITNPFEALAFGMAAIYGGKILGAYMSKAEAEPEPSEIDDLNSVKNVPKKRGRPRK